jgi:hypothetical protein
MNSKLISVLGSNERTQEAIEWIRNAMETHEKTKNPTAAVSKAVAEGHLTRLVSGMGQFNAEWDGGLATTYPEVYRCYLRQRGWTTEKIEEELNQLLADPKPLPKKRGRKPKKLTKDVDETE